MRVLQLASYAGVALAACNGHDELCGKKYSEVHDVGTHDSAFVGKTPTHNQYISVADQLESGVRFLQAQTHDKDGAIEMCHSFCWELDAGPLTDYLKTVADWVKNNPNEVVTLLLTNQDAIGMDKFDTVFDAVGLKQYVFHPKSKLSKDQWPTLQEMIDDGTRVVVFMDYHTDQGKVDYIINEFDYFWEAPYGITDKTFPTCDVDRPPGGDPTKLMGIVNHMLNYKIGEITFPNQVDAVQTNSKDSIMKQVDLCVDKWHVMPKIVLVDWVNIGDAKQARLALNGLA